MSPAKNPLSYFVPHKRMSDLNKLSNYPEYQVLIIHKRTLVSSKSHDDTINDNGLKFKKLVELENALVDLQKRLTSLEVTNEALRKELNNVNGLKEDFDCLRTKLDKTQSKNEELESKLKTATSILKALRPIVDNIEEISEFFSKKREEKEASAQVEADKPEIELKEQNAKGIEKRKFRKEFEEEMNNYRRDGYDR
jgi:DNA repair exonuclease SbcCD ATPase subunit